MNAVIYARTSKDDDEKEGKKSIPEQIAECQALAKAQGYKVLSVIPEPNRSGRTYPTGCPLASQDSAVASYFDGKAYTRDGLAKALAMPVDVIIVRDMTRLARPLSNSFLLNFLQQTFQSKKVKIHSVQEGLQDGVENHFVRTISAMIQDTDIQKRRAYSKGKLAQNKDKGQLAAGVKILGYRYAGKQKVEIDEKAANVVREIYKMKLDGKSTSSIATHLNATKALGKNLWRPQYLIQVLYKRPQYFGYSFNTQKQLIKSTVIPALLPYSLDVFKKLRSEHEKRVDLNVRESKREHLLSGLIYCGACGAKMTIWSVCTAWGPKQRLETHYYCPNHKYKKAGHVEACKGSGIKERCLVDFFGKMAFVLSKRRDQLQASDSSKETLSTLEAQRSKLLKAQDTLYGMIGDMETATFSRQSKIIEDKIKVIDGEVARLNLVPTRDTITPDDVKDFYRHTITSITSHPDKISVLLSGESKAFDIPRLRTKQSKFLPFPLIVPTDDKSKLELKFDCKGMAKGVIFQTNWLKLIAV